LILSQRWGGGGVMGRGNQERSRGEGSAWEAGKESPYETSRSATDLQQICFAQNRKITD